MFGKKPLNPDFLSANGAGPVQLGFLIPVSMSPGETEIQFAGPRQEARNAADLEEIIRGGKKKEKGVRNSDRAVAAEPVTPPILRTAPSLHSGSAAANVLDHIRSPQACSKFNPIMLT